MARTRIATAALALGALLALAVPAQAQTTFDITNSGATNYSFAGLGLDPTLTLERGQTYTFEVDASGHPFWIKTVQSTGTGNAYNDGVTNNGTAVGTITFTVPQSAPDTLYYNCQIHSAMTGTINIVDPPPAVGAPGLSATGVALTALLILAVATLGRLAMRRTPRAQGPG